MSLIDDIRAGSNEAIKQLYQENAQDVYDFAKGITGNHDTAMQATKNTLSKLVQQIQSGSEPANLHSEALKLAYDEACKIAMPSVQNIRSPYDDEEEEPEVKKAPAREKRQAEPPVRASRQSSSRRRDQYIEDDYYEEEEEDYEPAPRRQVRGNRRDYEPAPRQNTRPRSRQDYYDEEYDDYDDYDDRYDDYDDFEEKRGRGAGFYICLFINIILVLLLIWFLIGLLINLGVLPDSIDLGYTWFDNTIYPLF